MAMEDMIPFLNVGWQTPPDYALGERDTDVLSVINSEDLTVFTFDGLKRRLGLHPETLSRILARLEQEGLLTKEAHGYKVSPRITKIKLHEPKKIEQVQSSQQIRLIYAYPKVGCRLL